MKGQVLSLRIRRVWSNTGNVDCFRQVYIRHIKAYGKVEYHKKVIDLFVATENKL